MLSPSLPYYISANFRFVRFCGSFFDLLHDLVLPDLWRRQDNLSFFLLYFCFILWFFSVGFGGWFEHCFVAPAAAVVRSVSHIASRYDSIGFTFSGRLIYGVWNEEDGYMLIWFFNSLLLFSFSLGTERWAICVCGSSWV